MLSLSQAVSTLQELVIACVKLDPQRIKRMLYRRGFDCGPWEISSTTFPMRKTINVSWEGHAVGKLVLLDSVMLSHQF